jgi:TatD DNase family protein
MQLIDSHTHLEDPAFDADRDAVYARAEQAGIGVVIPGVDLKSSEAAVALAARWPLAWALVGVHPHAADTVEGDWAERLAHLARQPKVVGIGEVGFDRVRSRTTAEQQRAVFEFQRDLAARLGLPLSVHVREAEDDWRAAFRTGLAVTGVLHAFTGSRALAAEALDRGWYLGVSGIVTFRNAEALRALVAWAPLDRLVVETDAPYLAPTPYRGRRNEPAFVEETARAVARIKSRPEEEVFPQLVANTIKAFPRLSAPGAARADGIAGGQPVKEE